MTSRWFGPTRLMVAAACLWLCATTASAQYFGRNKVQYKKLDFQILKTEHFDIYFYPEEKEGAELAARLAERWHARLEKLFSHQLRGRQPLVLYASHPDFEQTNAIPGDLGEGTGGVTEPLRRRIVLPLGGPLADTDHVIGHELVHAFQFDITTRPGQAPGETGANALPLWFIEGMAEYLSLGPVDANTAMWLRDAARREKLPTVDDLNNPKYFPYRWGQAFWAYVGGRWGDEIIGDMLRTAGRSGDAKTALERQLGLTTKEFSEDWHAAIRRAYQPVFAATTAPSEAGRVTLKGEGLGGDLNVGPAISPDGRKIAFLSERSFFSIDLFVADATTGKVLRKLTKTSTDPHYSSLQFIYSAGAWAPDSRRLAIATVTAGRPALAIFDADTGNKEQEIRIDRVDEIFNPTWAPDGRTVCFTGMSSGLTDLYVLDLASSAVKPLTSDPYADLQPAWSPDGRRIAFATDRFTSNLGALQMGALRLGIIDVATGSVTPVPAPPAGKDFNPQWSPDGRSLFFLSDRDGIPNLYSVNLSTGGISQFTAVATGLSGITSTSPALSVSTKTGIAAFTVYDEGNYHVYTRDLTATASNTPTPDLKADVLPPLDRKTSDVATMLATPQFGLPALQAYESVDYRTSLKLDGVGQPFIGIGADRFGTAIGGGLSLAFSDMLGNQNLIVAGQVQAGISGNYDFGNTAAQAVYLNASRRWNWGLVGGQVPYLSGGIRQSVGRVGNEPVLVDETVVFRQTDRSAAGIVAYPFDRARRVEFQGGASRISFDQILQTQVFSLNSGNLLAENRETTSIGDPLTLYNASAAYVHDTANFGATSPVQGQRYRLEAAPTFGTINYTSFLADYRRYFMPVSFYTIAGRVMHYGRYGSGGQDSRLFPLFLGYPNLVRGYDTYTFDAAECGVSSSSNACPAFDQLLGSRVLVGNLEFRFPLLRPFGARQSMYGPIPVEVALFTDGGVAWDRGETPFQTSGRKGVSSSGVSLRANLFGFAIGEFAFSKPWQRPGKGWVFQFNLSPGF